MKFDHQAIPADEYRALLKRREWTHVAAAELFGVTSRTSKAYAKDGVPSGLASLAIRAIMADDAPESGQSPAREARVAFATADIDAFLKLGARCDRLETQLSGCRAEIAEKDNLIARLLSIIRRAASAFVIGGDARAAGAMLFDVLEEDGAR